MPSEPGNTATPFSIFISYASADRPQARLLGETLTKAGLDVWFDEEELAGGEAWDSKIRQQIRTCTYFMPVISATTEARREGYFRREWRLAVERTLDLADDVMFLIPVVIDDTPEYRARVPEKFTSVQWLRCPAGRETPQLVALARRLAAESAAPVTAAPPPATPPRAPPPAAPPKLTRATAAKTAAAAAGLYPFPVFPAFPASGQHRSRFLYDLIVWAGHMLRALWVRLPRWLRLLAMVVIVFKAINAVFDRSTGSLEIEHPKKSKIRATPATAPGETKQDAATNDEDSDDSTVEKILHATGAALDAFQGGRPLAVIAFGSSDKALQAPALKAFAAFRAHIAGDGHEKEVALGIVPLAPGFADAEALARATSLKCRWLLTGIVSPDPAGLKLEVKLYDAEGRKLLWQSSRTGPIADATEIGKALAVEAHAQIPSAAVSPPATPGTEPAAVPTPTPAPATTPAS